mmetsp:Transcript_13853/g.39452  ORF Transcript_13853/g.39452 Transcript_13853/m.39452 type:complete len:249 (+) Transcript_13853:344-1090(+)
MIDDDFGTAGIVLVVSMPAAMAILRPLCHIHLLWISHDSMRKDDDTADGNERYDRPKALPCHHGRSERCQKVGAVIDRHHAAKIPPKHYQLVRYQVRMEFPQPPEGPQRDQHARMHQRHHKRNSRSHDRVVGHEVGKVQLEPGLDLLPRSFVQLRRGRRERILRQAEVVRRDAQEHGQRAYRLKAYSGSCVRDCCSEKVGNGFEVDDGGRLPTRPSSAAAICSVRYPSRCHVLSVVCCWLKSKPDRSQ